MSKKVEGVEDLRQRVYESRKARHEMKQHFGFIPMSVLHLHRGALSRKMFNYQVERRKQTYMGKERRKKTRMIREAGLADSTCSNSYGGLTMMPAELVEYFIKYYAQPRDVYLDPFMGQGIRMQVAKMYGLDYYGYDICEDFVAYIEEVQDKIDDGATVIKPYLGDSRYPMNIPDGIGDFCFTSPPYYDIEYYDDAEGQLGQLGTYQDFLEGLEEVARAWLPKFKPGAWVIVNTNDFRRDGKFYSYHTDCIALFESAGYCLHDLWVIEGLVGGLPKSFALYFNQKRIAPKVHEYAMVFRCPE